MKDDTMSKDDTNTEPDDRPFYRFTFTDRFGTTFEVVGQIRSETPSEVVIDTTDDEERKYSRSEYPGMVKTLLPSDGPLPVFFGPE